MCIRSRLTASDPDQELDLEPDLHEGRPGPPSCTPVPGVGSLTHLSRMNDGRTLVSTRMSGSCSLCVGTMGYYIPASATEGPTAVSSTHVFQVQN